MRQCRGASYIPIEQRLTTAWGWRGLIENLHQRRLIKAITRNAIKEKRQAFTLWQGEAKAKALKEAEEALKALSAPSRLLLVPHHTPHHVRGDYDPYTAVLSAAKRSINGTCPHIWIGWQKYGVHAYPLHTSSIGVLRNGMLYFAWRRLHKLTRWEAGEVVSISSEASSFDHAPLA